MSSFFKKRLLFLVLIASVCNYAAVASDEEEEGVEDASTKVIMQQLLKSWAVIGTDIPESPKAKISPFCSAKSNPDALDFLGETDPPAEEKKDEAYEGGEEGPPPLVSTDEDGCEFSEEGDDLKELRALMEGLKVDLSKEKHSESGVGSTASSSSEPKEKTEEAEEDWEEVSGETISSGESEEEETISGEESEDENTRRTKAKEAAEAEMIKRAITLADHKEAMREARAEAAASGVEDTSRVPGIQASKEGVVDAEKPEIIRHISSPSYI